MDGVKKELSEGQIEFLKIEYQEMRVEVIERLKSAWGLERFGLGGAAAIAAWLFTNSSELKGYEIAWWLPFVFLSLCAIRIISINYHLMNRVSKYISGIERDILGVDGGFESWFSKQPLNETIAHSVVWGLAVMFALILAISKT
ncbi:hypothetical protein [Pseudomonas knackmussii]|uniref:hypothetical protein n=1 Tax=Pseudomonas knackmussii TaxID=65741 RepID=UPI003F49F317